MPVEFSTWAEIIVMVTSEKHLSCSNSLSRFSRVAQTVIFCFSSICEVSSGEETNEKASLLQIFSSYLWVYD